jgi:hypothetical protein
MKEIVVIGHEQSARQILFGAWHSKRMHCAHL